MLGTMLNSDLSPGETVGLHWDDIDFCNNTITVRRSIDDQLRILPPKGGERTITLTPEAKSFLVFYREKHRVNKSTPQVFHKNGRYLHISSLLKRMQRLVTERGRNNLSIPTFMNYSGQLKQLHHKIAAEH
jgi:integrase